MLVGTRVFWLTVAPQSVCRYLALALCAEIVQKRADNAGYEATAPA